MEKDSYRWFSITSVVGFLLLALAGEAIHRYELNPTSYSPLQGADAQLGPDYYFAYEDYQIDHLVQFFGLKGVIKHMRKADVLILGNSQSQHAFRREFVQDFFTAAGLKVYHLGFGYGDGVSFAFDIIEKFDLKPRLIIVNIGGDFFNNRYSTVAHSTTNHTKLFAIQEVNEKIMSRAARVFLSRVFAYQYISVREKPKDTFTKFAPLRLDERLPFEEKSQFRKFESSSILVPATRELLMGVNHRSISTGFWSYDYELPWKIPIVPRSGKKRREAAAQKQLKNAIEFQREMNKRSSTLILTLVPNNFSGNQNELRDLGRSLKIPVIFPKTGQLYSSDWSHLTKESAKEFSAAFLKELPTTLKKHGICFETGCGE